MSRADAIHAFWFQEPATDAPSLFAKLRRWYQGGPDLDREITERFAGDVEAALTGTLDGWATEPRGRVALVLLLDQFTRSVYRGSARTYAGDAKAQALAVEAFDRGLVEALSIDERNFLIMPLTHAEDLSLQERSVELMERLVADAAADLRPVYAMGIEQTKKYLEVIRRFGRFPHRNELLGRASTDDEVAFLRDWTERQPPSAMRPS